MTASQYLLEAIDIVKVFGTLRANDGVTLQVTPGQIHALLGENGAGKSTLVKMIYGSLQPTSGTIKWKGQDVVIPNPNAARKLGIGMVFQHFSLFEALTVVENISLAIRENSILRRCIQEGGVLFRRLWAAAEPQGNGGGPVGGRAPAH